MSRMGALGVAEPERAPGGAAFGAPPEESARHPKCTNVGSDFLPVTLAKAPLFTVILYSLMTPQQDLRELKSRCSIC